MNGSFSTRMLRTIAAWVVVAIFFFPIYYWTSVAFKHGNDIFNRPPKLFAFTPTFDNFQKVFGISLGSGGITVTPGGGNFYMAPRVWDSIVIATLSTVLAVAIATLAAYALSRMHFRGRHSFVGWVLSTRMMPPVAVAVPMFFIYKNFGLIDTYTGMVLIHALMNLPLAVLLMKSFFDDIPSEIDESAIVDGASRFMIFRRIVLPMAKGGIAATAVLCFIFSWTEFLFALTLTTTSLKTVPVVSSTFVTSIGTAWGNMAALGAASIIPAFIFILLVQKHLVRGLTMGSLKQ
ncbi:MAG: carbohydrate ABC transporter permease [Mesorhizobium sp.]|uniref:carbohydrate ABC transporter permease n=1 Tax=Mesorhizobium sp. TaxID=1871066 RepID=UPI000FE3961E|nr:carbohydrate ABC transporter permease [Mesorhizobium sp.]RWO32959.1 MAG: carbohydrate ABC transporter permease [Mesorhizobium sp.]RWO47115.1 MAG: carbohydrate ABC transporter permease [Mesorhizobium sp.]RWO80746.1 MAG: carbohydrate ABC transporter permease [Mesorhizobium sp.]TIN80804.1 MAG: ABC transporter permease subunit [Mesorhizobium sp.]